jgi:thiol-disulfide isomerase/thioredoxin
MRRKMNFILPFLLLASCLSFAQNGHKIEVRIGDFAEKELMLGYYLLDKQYILDTASINDSGAFIFKGDKELPGGLYIVVMPPENRFFQILISPGEQHFSLNVPSAANPVQDITIKGSPDNKRFYEYINTLAAKRPEAEQLRQKIDATADKEEKAILQKQLDELNEWVTSYQKDLIKKYPKSMTAAIVHANLPMDMPEFEGSPEEVQLKQWQYSKEHYFDNIDLADPRMLRTPFLFQRAEFYIDKVTVPHPDSISRSLDYLLERFRPAEETFKHYLVHFLNFYARSKIVGMDAVYVHLADKYYATGQADWVEQEQLDKIVENANSLRPILIGKIAPDITMVDKRDSIHTLHGIKSPYTVLFIWDPDCGHCKKTMPEMLQFYRDFKDRGVEMMAVCGKFYNDLDKCWEFIESKDMNIWLNVVDPYHRSKYKTLYDVKTTPQIFILDEKKEIISKRIGVEQLPEVMERIMEIRSRNNEKGS